MENITRLAYYTVLRRGSVMQKEVQVGLLLIRNLYLSPCTHGSKHKKTSSSPSNTGKGGDPNIISPSTIQVFSDPLLAQTVRDLAINFQKSKNVIKNLREDLEDCTFELLRQGQNNDTLETTVKETTKLLKQCNQQDVPKLVDNLKELQENVVYFSKLAANQENRLLDMNDNVQSALSELSKHAETLKTFQKDFDKFRKDSEIYRLEATAAFAETKILKREFKYLKSEMDSIRPKNM